MDSQKEIVLNFKRESFFKLINTVSHPTKPIQKMMYIQQMKI